MDNQFLDNTPSTRAVKVFKAVFNGAIDGMVIIDEKGQIRLVNSASARLFGYSSDELTGHNVSMLMPNPHRRLHDSYIEKYRSSGQAKIIGIGREVEGRKKDGSLFPLRLAVSEINVNQRTYFVGILHDMTEQKRVESEIRKLNEELEKIVEERTEKLTEVVNKLLDTNKKLEAEIGERQKVEEMLREREAELRKVLEKEIELSGLKSRFVSMASHEFRTPLSTILSSAAILSRYREADQHDKRERHVNRIKSSVENLTGILNDFLSLSRLEEGKIEVSCEEFHWNSFCREVIEELEGNLRPGQHIVHASLNPDPTVRLDKRLMKNILFNLLSNASKYSTDGKTIIFKNSIENDNLHIEIIDQGMGIPEADQHHLFTRFFRAANVINIQGTGLGLTIVKQYLELLNGSIYFKSEQGKGTTFFVDIALNKQVCL